jgi:N-methylhydantoinase A
MNRTLGVDVGGTFTDVVVWDGAELATAKVPSTPEDQSRGVVAGANAVTEGADRFLHGTTVATNALLEKTGARTALVTSPGFEDVLEIGRQDRPSLYDQDAERPEPLVPRRMRWSPASLDLAELDQVESVAVSLLYSYLDPATEFDVRSHIKARFPDLPVSVSSEVAREFREFERTSTTVLNAYVRPTMARYLSRLAAVASGAGLPDRVLVMLSSGGLISAAGVAAHPAAALLSGPAGGVMAATELGRALGRDDLITFDMGGTSTDVCRIDDGRPEISHERDVAGYPCRLPSVAIHTVGAGGGSIGWVDPGGALRVGPRSAGANPGPVAYGHGGSEPTVTDANLVLGRIDPSARLGRDIVLAPDASNDALARLGERLGLDARWAAAGMVEVVEEVMAGALRRVSIEQGVDPRRSTLVAFGGAGGLHGSALARRIGMAGMVVPLHAGVFSALGLLLSPPRQDWAHTVMTSDVADVDRQLRTFAQLAEEQLRSDGVEPVEVRTAVDVRYVGQSHELSVGYSAGDGWAALAERFHRLHTERNGFARPDDEVEAVTVRVEAFGAPSLTWRELPEMKPAGEPGRGTRQVVAGGSLVEATVWWRPGLAPGAELVGPAVVEEAEATTFLHPGERAVIHDSGALEVEW